MFQKTAASFDECSTAGVFLSTLHCQDYRSELLFPSDVQTLSTGEPLKLPDLGWVEMSDLKGRYNHVFYQSISVIREALL
jgi:condensin complex subunit 2